MNRARYLLRGLLFLATLLAFDCTACELKIAYNVVALPPYYVGHGEAIPALPGVAIELVNLAAAREGCHVRWTRMPGKRVLRELEHNGIDGMLALSYSAPRAAFAVYPMKNGTPNVDLAVWTLSYDFYVRPGSTLRWDGQQFNRPPHGVGANAGFSIVKDLAQFGLAVEEATGEQNNLDKLMRERIEVYAGQDLVVDQFRELPEFSRVEKLRPSIVQKTYFLVFSKSYYANSTDLAHKLWKQIAEVRKTQGQTLHKKYRQMAQPASGAAPH